MMIDERFYIHDPKNDGTKGLVFIGDKIIIYRRDFNTELHPGELDVPGGGYENGERPIDTFIREVKEEFNLELVESDFEYARMYFSAVVAGKFGWFCVARVDEKRAEHLMLGDEGLDYMLLTIDEYLSAQDAWPTFQERTQNYLDSLKDQL